jgi:hypothetical protein
LVDGTVLEGQVWVLSVNPLLRLSGFNRSPITIRVETAIAPIELPESKIMGRMDLLAIRTREDGPDFWVLVVDFPAASAEGDRAGLDLVDRSLAVVRRGSPHPTSMPSQSSAMGWTC